MNHHTMNGKTLISILAMSASIAIISSSCDSSRPPDHMAKTIAPDAQDQVLTAYEPTQVISANLSDQDLQVIKTEQVQHAQFASQTAEPCDTCGNSIWRVFNTSRQGAMITAFLALLAIASALWYRHHRRSITAHN